MNDYIKYQAFTKVCEKLGLQKENIEVLEAISLADDLIIDESVNDRIKELVNDLSDDSINESDISKTFVQGFYAELGQEKIDEARRLVSKIKTTGKEAKAREGKAIVMKELNKNKQYIAAAKKLLAIATREAKKIAREKGIKPNLISIERVAIK